MAYFLRVLWQFRIQIRQNKTKRKSEKNLRKRLYDAETTLITGEDKSLRKENEKRFRHKDGSYSAVLYAAPVHYKDSFRNWQDVDNSLVMKSDESGNAVYSPTASGNNIQIPRTFSDGQTMLVEKDGYKIELGIMTDRSIEDMQLGIIASPEIPIGENPDANSSINANDIWSALPSEDSVADIQGVVREEDSNCSWPCKYYPLKCTENCTHINEPENGFQFKITY